MTTCANHAWRLIHRLNHCEIDEADSVAHTMIVLLGCTVCKTVDAFPPQNAALLTERYRMILRNDLARQGWDWPDERTA